VLHLKGLKVYVSGLESTLAGLSIRVDSKGALHCTRIVQPFAPEVKLHPSRPVGIKYPKEGKNLTPKGVSYSRGTTPGFGLTAHIPNIDNTKRSSSLSRDRTAYFEWGCQYSEMGIGLAGKIDGGRMRAL